MKLLSLTLLAAALAMTTGSALAAVPRGEQAAARMPAASPGEYSMRKVDWHEHGDDDEGDDDGGGLDFGFDNTWAPGWDSYWGAEPSYYYNPPVVVSKASSPAKVYISSEQKSKPFYWYYCKSARRYYPYVSQCPGGWTKVAPRPSKN